jgi:hypothetical protein
MSYYKDIYLKRLNRYGLDYQSRLQGMRERNFDNYLLKTVYKVSFLFNDEEIIGSFEKYKQDETETLHYLLTKIDVDIPAGTVLFIPSDEENNEKPWLVYYKETIKASGYNRYIMLKMTHYLTWIDRSGETQNAWAYLYGQENNMLKDEIRSRSRMDTIYSENLKSSFFITPLNEKIRKDDYFTVGSGELLEAFRVTGYDLNSTEGIEYVTIDPVYIRDDSPAPEKSDEDRAEDWFWLEMGGVN